MWAILSGIEGNIEAYEAVLADMRRRKNIIENIYILGDIIGASLDNETVVQRLRFPHSHELKPQVCPGWWEEQCFILHGIGSTTEPIELLEKYGAESVKKLWKSVSPETLQWLRGLDFGFVELDCLLIHGSSISITEELTPQTDPWLVLDRLQRMDVNTLFCGRSGLVFEYQLEIGSIDTSVITLDVKQPKETVRMTPKRVVGVGNVGREDGKATYTLYHPPSGQVESRTVYYCQRKRLG